MQLSSPTDIPSMLLKLSDKNSVRVLWGLQGFHGLTKIKTKQFFKSKFTNSFTKDFPPCNIQT